MGHLELRPDPGDLTRLHEEVPGPRDLEAKFQAFPGVGPVKVNIFLRELRGIRAKADPVLSGLTLPTISPAPQIGARLWRGSRGHSRRLGLISLTSSPPW